MYSGQNDLLNRFIWQVDTCYINLQLIIYICGQYMFLNRFNYSHKYTNFNSISYDQLKFVIYFSKLFLLDSYFFIYVSFVSCSSSGEMFRKRYMTILNLEHKLKECNENQLLLYGFKLYNGLILLQKL